MQQPYLKVNEIFYSLQGEGKHTGMAAIFIRLAGCSMQCSFCDTKYAAQTGTDLSNTEILTAFSAYPCKNIIITGGEPTEQDFKPLARALKEAGYTLHLETNGSIDFDISLLDFVTVSPKRYVSPEMLKKADVIKIVVGQHTDLADLSLYFSYQNAKTSLYLQPESNLQENIDLCVNLIKQNPSLRLSLQTHRLIHLR